MPYLHGSACKLETVEVLHGLLGVFSLVVYDKAVALESYILLIQQKIEINTCCRGREGLSRPRWGIWRLVIEIFCI